MSSAYGPASRGMQVPGHQLSLVNRDLYGRFLPWPLLLLSMTVAIATLEGDWLGQPGWIALFCTLYLVNWLLHRRAQPPDCSDWQEHTQWQRGVWIYIYSTSLLWGLFYGWIASSQPVLSYAFLLATGVTQALAFSSCDAYPMHPRKNMVALALLQVPCWLALLATEQSFKLLVFFGLLMVVQALRIRSSARHYAQLLSNEVALHESRREIERLSTQDALTGLSNRRGLHTTLYSQWHLAARQQDALSLICLDIDHLKRLNERLGHGAGDACLRHVAGLLRNQFRRSSDMVARMGGDSFAVLLPQTDAMEAMRLAQALREQLLQTPLLWNEQGLQITASMGVDCARWDMDLSPDDTLKRITAACHEAKGKGRNRVLQA